MLLIVIRYELLLEVNRVSKMLQPSDLQMDMAISLLDALLQWFRIFRTSNYDESIARNIANENNIDPTFPERRLARSKRHFNYERAYEANANEKKSFS